MKKHVFTDAVVYLICMVAACLLNLAVGALAVKIVNLLIEVGYFEAAIIKTVSGLVVGGAVLGAVVGRECYQAAELRPWSLLASLTLAGAGHLLLCVILMFYPFISGGVRDLAGLLAMGDSFNDRGMIERIYLWNYLAAFGIDFAVRAAVSLTAGAIGKHMRLKSRESLLSREQTEQPKA